MLQGLGIETGINLDFLIAAGERCCTQLGRKNHSSVANARAD
jgi:hydroxymethylglutaryl-CoA lyase